MRVKMRKCTAVSRADHHVYTVTFKLPDGSSREALIALDACGTATGAAPSITVYGVSEGIEVHTPAYVSQQGLLAGLRRELAHVLHGVLHNLEGEFNPYSRAYVEHGLKALESARMDASGIVSWMDAADRELTGAVLVHAAGQELDRAITERINDGWRLMGRMYGPTYALTLAGMTRGAAVVYLCHDGTVLCEREQDGAGWFVPREAALKSLRIDYTEYMQDRDGGVNHLIAMVRVVLGVQE